MSSTSIHVLLLVLYATTNTSPLNALSSWSLRKPPTAVLFRQAALLSTSKAPLCVNYGILGKNTRYRREFTLGSTCALVEANKLKTILFRDIISDNLCRSDHGAVVNIEATWFGRRQYFFKVSPVLGNCGNYYIEFKSPKPISIFGSKSYCRFRVAIKTRQNILVLNLRHSSNGVYPSYIEKVADVLYQYFSGLLSSELQVMMARQSMLESYQLNKKTEDNARRTAKFIRIDNSEKIYRRGSSTSKRFTPSKELMKKRNPKQG